MDVSVGTRLRVLRKDVGLTQAQLAALADTNQAAINRYETDRAAAPYRILVWYATYFNVSLDYIFGLCEDPRGRYVCVTPEGAQEVVQCKPDWSEFVEACFTPSSELNRRLKQMILNMGEEEKHKEGGARHECRDLCPLQQRQAAGGIHRRPAARMQGVCRPERYHCGADLH